MKKMARLLLLAVNVVLVLLLWGSTLAGMVAPSRFMWFSFLSYGCHIFLLLNAAFALIWLLKGRRECLVSLIGIGVRIGFVPLYVQLGGNSDPVQEADRNLLTVMSCNIHHFQGRNDDPGVMQENAVRFLAIVDEEQPDVMCVQEFFEPGKVNVGDSLKARGYRYRYGAHMSRTGVPSGVSLFSRHPIDYVGEAGSCGIYYADIIKRETIVRVVPVHLKSYELTEADHEEFERMVHGDIDTSAVRSAMGKFRAAILGHEEEWDGCLRRVIDESPRPIVVAGDFNDTPASRICCQMRKHLRDTYVEQGRGLGATYHGRFPHFRIDYIWHSESVKALRYKRIRSDISDHYPIIATFEL